MSSVKTDVNPSDIGTKALGCERFHRSRSMLGMGTELIETSSPGRDLSVVFIFSNNSTLMDCCQNLHMLRAWTIGSELKLIL